MLRLQSLLLLVVVSAAEASPEISAYLEAQSKYITEGRDNLERGGLYAANVDAGEEHWFANLWYGEGSHSKAFDQDRYQEANLSLGLPISWGDYSAQAGITWLKTLNDGLEDKEFFAGLAWQNGGSTLSLDATYADVAAGWFLEARLEQSLQIDDDLELLPSLGYGWDFGYASEDHSGENHALIALTLRYTLLDSLWLEAHVNRAFAREGIRKEGGEHISWGGIRLHWAL